jgi:hypothetical protein
MARIVDTNDIPGFLGHLGSLRLVMVPTALVFIVLARDPAARAAERPKVIAPPARRWRDSGRP